MKKLLFIAGEPGAGKSKRLANPLGENGLGLVLNTDRISERASRYYKPNLSLSCRWQFWKLEFDDDRNRNGLVTAFRESIEECSGKPVDQETNLIVEGVLSGHPAFRSLLIDIVYPPGFTPESVSTLAICPPWDQLLQNLKERGRPKDQNIEFVKERSDDYNRRLFLQKDVKRYSITDECYQAAVTFLAS